jgi:hypothetical protein
MARIDDEFISIFAGCNTEENPNDSTVCVCSFAIHGIEEDHKDCMTYGSNVATSFIIRPASTYVLHQHHCGDCRHGPFTEKEILYLLMLVKAEKKKESATRV